MIMNLCSSYTYKLTDYSLFYRKLLKNKMPEVGFTKHTKTEKAYKLKHDLKLYLVDFPGGNGTEDYADE